MTFADITIVPVSSDRKDAYLAFAQRMASVYREHGATKIVEYWQASDPVNQDEFHADGVIYDSDELQAFATLVGAAPSESVVVSITEWPSKDARDRGTAAATKDPRVFAALDEDPIFDGSRLIAASFETAMSLLGLGDAPS